MTVIKDFLLQLALVTCLLFAFQIFFAERLERNTRLKVIMPFVFGTAILLCMTFPAYVGDEYRLDIRIIPMLLGTLYGGVESGIFLSLLIVLYRLYIGVDLGFYNTIITLLFGLPVFLYFQKHFISASKNKRVRIVLLLSAYYSIIGSLTGFLFHPISREVIQIQIIHLLTTLIFVGFFTSLNEFTREIILKNQQLLSEAERLRVVSVLTSVFAHEIRNPMQVTRGFLQLLNEPHLPAKNKQYIRYSIEELDRANAIIDDLLAYGKPAAQDLTRFDVALELRRVENLIQSYAISNNVTIQTRYEDNCWIEANPQKLNQSLINILKNAIESMPGGGTIWLSCFSNDERYVEICVKDQGIGMTKEQIDKLGAPFYSLKESGTGLGMMVSLQIIRNFHGKVKITSELDVGTEFSIYLPRIT
ncbi:ATP-binding protein [Paenibacillus aestuarii]|uniref:histidine kinase n=1 Tax=Paenibacillus aestuarii TaxID=516965 RepID=A0ABW0KIY0_9BACL|nr:ATP-binding protein [Paenibacillus aestuarii]